MSLGNPYPPLNHGTSNTTSDGLENDRDKFWSAYLEEAKKYDNELLEKYKTDIDIVVFFAGLFSAVVAGFLAAIQPTLSPNSSDTTNALLMILIHTIDNSTFSDQPLTFPQSNGPSYTVVASQALGYVSLSFSLSAALGAVVGKQWLSRYSRLGTGTDEARGRRRQQKLEALETWKFHVTMKLLPALLQVALALFAIALCINLWGMNRVVALAFICATALSGLAYMGLTVASLWFPSCPYETPFSAVIRWMITTAIGTGAEIAWPLMDQRLELAVRQLIRLSPLLFLPVFGWGTIVLTVVVAMALVMSGWILTMKSGTLAFRELLIGLDSFKSRWRLPLSPQYLDFSSGAWILELSTRQGVVTTAVERLSDAAVQPYDSHGSKRIYRDCDGVQVQRLARHLYLLFIDSLDQMYDQPSINERDRTTAFGQALVSILQFGQKFKLDDTERFWDGAASSTMTLFETDFWPEINYLVRLVFALLPEAKNAQNTTHSIPSELVENVGGVPNHLLLWSFPFLQSALLQPRNLHLIGVLSALHPALESDRFADGRNWSALELSSYLRTCLAYLEILGQWHQMRLNQGPKVTPVEVNTVVYVGPPGNPNWKVIRQILVNLHDTDESRNRLWEDECLPKILNQLSNLLKIYPSWPGDTQSLVHRLAFGIYFWAKELPTRDQSTRLVDSAINLAATDPYPENYVDPKIDQILPFLLDQLSFLPYSWEKEALKYILKIVQACPAEVIRLVALSPRFVTHFFKYTGDPSIRRVDLEILSAACESGSSDEVLEPLVCQDRFRYIIHRAIGSENQSLRVASLRFLDAALTYLLRDQSDRATWQRQFGHALFQISASDPPAPNSPFRLIRIKCALCPDKGSNELSAYWRGWMDNQSALDVARVVPVAQWVLTHCEPSPPQAWYTDLRDGFEGLLLVAWGGNFTDNSPLLRDLMDCTAKWLQTLDSTAHGNTTLAAVRVAARQILENQEYDLGEDDANALQRLKFGLQSQNDHTIPSIG